MWYLALRMISVGSLFFATLSTAFAQCTEDRRRIEVGPDVVQLGTYLCRTGRGPSDAQVRVEFDRVSDAVASMIITGYRSDMLSQVIGTPKLISNDVSKAYSELLRQFGVTLGSELSLQQLTINGADSAGTGSTSQHILDKGIRILGAPYFQSSLSYPAMDEITALQKRDIPAGMKYFYSVYCKDEEIIWRNKIPSACKTFDPQQAPMVFWRGMTAADVTNYSRRISAYNRQYASKKRTDIIVPRELLLAYHLAGNTWPEDFMLLTGTAQTDGCEAGFFWYGPRAFMLDVAIIENVSSARISIDDILGERVSDTELRVATSFAPQAKSSTPLTPNIGTLAPREKVLVPLRIFLSPNEDTTRQFRYRETANQIQKQIRARGYSGNVGGYGAPIFRNYVYGPQVALAGLVINGTRVDLAGGSANYLEITMSMEAGSCPYLLSQAADGDWIDYGKVLHKAPNKESEYSELKVFDGFKHRFRLEEREPEMAFIDQVELLAVLKTGDTLALVADNPKLRTRDGDYLRLLWGDAIDINFALPTDIRAEDVVESRLYVTGYYLRYSSLIAKTIINEPVTRRSSVTSSPIMGLPTLSER
jgi:hypothetical protein